MSFRQRLRIAGTALWTSGSSFTGSQDQIAVGRDIPDLSVNLDATGSQNWQQCPIPLAVVSGTPVVLDLNNASNTLLDRVNRPFQLTNLIFAALILTDPGAGISLQLGPLGGSDAAQLWYGGVTSGFYETVDYSFIRQTLAGWTIASGGARKLTVQNPGTGTVAATLWLAGTM